MNMTRRNLLRALGLGGAAYFTPWTRRKAKAANSSSTVPNRILFFYTPHGTLMRQWVTAPSGASAPTATNFGLGPILMPLSALQKKLTILTGFSFVSNYVDPIAASNGHTQGQTHALSATNRADSEDAGGISIDQFIANGINSPTPVTSIPALQISARNVSNTDGMTVSWAGSNQLISPLTDPAAVYSLMFPSGPPSSQSSSSMSTQSTAATALATRRKSVLDSVLGEFNAITQPLSSADKTKLQSHAQMIRDLEVQQTLQPSVASGACVAPTQSAVTSAYAKDCPRGQGTNCLQDAMNAFASMIVAGFSCDITRVITMDCDQWPDAMFSNNPAVSDAGNIHQFLHGMDDCNWLMNDVYDAGLKVSSTAQDPTNLATGIQFYSQYAQFLATLCQQLDAIPEPDGTTLLDHTMVVWCSEIGSSNHSDDWVNYAILGGGAAGIKTGRYLNMPRTTPAGTGSYFPDNGPPHNNLFVSLANMMGLTSVTSFGTTKVCTGPNTQLMG